MAYPVGRLFDEMQIPQSDRELLTRRCIAAELEEAIDIAFVDAAMLPEILGVDEGRLGGLLMVAAKRAKPMVAGWARAGTKGGGGGVVSGEGPELVQASRPRDPLPGRAPCTVAGAGGPTVATQAARGANPSVVRSSRLLVSFTRNALKMGGKKAPGSPPRQHLSPR